MRMFELFDHPSIILSNEEYEFIKSHNNEIPLHSLFDHDEVMARHLVRKGIYEMSDDNRSIVLRTKIHK